MMKAGSCRSISVTKLLQKQRRDSHFNGIGLFRILSTGKTSVHLSRNPQGRKFGGITPEFLFRFAASQSPSKLCRAAAAGKIETRRLISRIILASVVNASSRRRRGLRATVEPLATCFFKFKFGGVFLRHSDGSHGLDWIVQCFTSPPTQYRLYGRRFLQVKRPNQQYQSTEGSYKGKQKQHKKT